MSQPVVPPAIPAFRTRDHQRGLAAALAERRSKQRCRCASALRLSPTVRSWVRRASLQPPKCGSGRCAGSSRRSPGPMYRDRGNSPGRRSRGRESPGAPFRRLPTAVTEPAAASWRLQLPGAAGGDQAGEEVFLFGFRFGKCCIDADVSACHHRLAIGRSAAMRTVCGRPSRAEQHRPGNRHRGCCDERTTCHAASLLPASLPRQKSRSEAAMLNTPGWIRTSDPRIRSPMLYPAELRGREPYLRAPCPFLPDQSPIEGIRRFPSA